VATGGCLGHAYELAARERTRTISVDLNRDDLVGLGNEGDYGGARKVA
jgi:hypothetical protein